MLDGLLIPVMIALLPRIDLLSERKKSRRPLVGLDVGTPSEEAVGVIMPLRG